MKLGFTTLGCPDWPYATIVARAREYGFDGFEIRGMMGEMDVHLPWRLFGQTPRQCWDNVGPHVVDTHIKDSCVTDGEQDGYRYCLLGEGDVPVPDTLQVLHAGGYDGYLTLEWEKAWKDYLPDPSVGFPQYVRQMRHYLAQLD